MKKLMLFLAIALAAICLMSCEQKVDAKTYIVSFDANGADSGTASSNISVKEGESIKSPSQGTLSKKGYDFAGWNTQSDGKGDFFRVSKTVVVKENMTLYAIWIDSGKKDPDDPISPINPSYTDDLLFSSFSEDYYVVDGCSNKNVSSIIIPSEYNDKPVIKIDSFAFSEFNNLMNITIPDSVTTIGESAFENCVSLTNIKIPSSVTIISDFVFSGCSSIESIEVDSENPVYYSEGNCIIEKESKKLVLGCKNSVIPKDVSSIGKYAFCGCSGLTSIIIPESVTSIESSAFRDCSGLTNITIPNSVTSIGDYAFYYCTGLTGITISSSVTSIRECAFNYCDILEDVKIDAKNPMYYVDNNCIFEKGSNKLVFALTSAVIPDGTVTIESNAFIGSKIKNVLIPASVTSIAKDAFKFCNYIESIKVDSVNSVYYSEGNCIIEKESKELVLGCKNSVIPEDVTSIGEYAFSGCSGLAEITIPEGVTSIGGGAFYGCSGLTSITIPEDVTSIGNYAFKNCTGLTSITITEGVTSIGDSAFLGCSGLADITYLGTTEQWSSITKSFNWNSSTGNYTIHCTDGDIAK